MASKNLVILIGNVGADPEVRYAPSGEAIANLRLATTDTWRDKATGEKKESTEWHRIAFFGRLAEVVQQYVKKGRSLYIEGRLQTRKWQDKEGRDQYTTEIRANELQLLGSPQQSRQEPPEAPPAEASRNAPARTSEGQGNRPAAAPRQGGGGSARVPAPANFGDFDDDIPFADSSMDRDPVVGRHAKLARIS